MRGPGAASTRRFSAVAASALFAACSLLGGIDDLQSGAASNNADASSDAPAIDGAEDVLIVDVACSGWCTLPNAQASCVDASCAIVSCNGSYEDCDQSAATGCEADTATSASHCGGCNQPCSAPDGTAQCTNGTCVVTCPAGRLNCNNDPADGCEAVPDYDGDNCGGCGTSCGSGEACSGGSCVTSKCSSGQGVLHASPSSDVSTGLWAASPSAPFWSKINDSPTHDATSTYVWDDTEAQPSQAIFGAESLTLPPGLAIHSLALSAWVRLNPSGSQPSEFWLIVRSGTSDDESLTQAITSSSWVQRSHIWTTKPEVFTPWTASDLGDLEIGFAHQKPTTLTNPVEVTMLLLEVCVEPE